MASTIPAPEISTVPQSPVVSSPVVKKPAPKRVSVPPPGYKFVKVRKDGVIKTVQRKLTPEELAAAEAAAATKAAVSPVASPNPGASPKSKSDQVATPKSPKVTSPVLGSSGQTPTTDTPKGVAVTTRAVDPESTDTVPDGPLSPEMQAALDEQKDRNRQSRSRKFRHSMVSGLAHLVAVAVPSIEIGNFHPDDEVVDHVDDPSDDDLDDEDDDDPDYQDKSKQMENGDQDEKAGHTEATRSPEHQGKLTCASIALVLHIGHIQLTNSKPRALLPHCTLLQQLLPLPMG
jgi:hypothetical protein